MTTINGVVVLFPPPEGYVVDFDNPARQGVPDAYIVAGFGLAISFLFFMQRMYVKIFLTGGLQLDDCKFSSLFCWFMSETIDRICEGCSDVCWRDRSALTR
jgi:hypothetical protein